VARELLLKANIRNAHHVPRVRQVHAIISARDVVGKALVRQQGAGSCPNSNSSGSCRKSSGAKGTPQQLQCGTNTSISGKGSGWGPCAGCTGSSSCHNRQLRHPTRQHKPMLCLGCVLTTLASCAPLPHLAPARLRSGACCSLHWRWSTSRGSPRSTPPAPTSTTASVTW
jgi:hypothetical protein